MDCPRCGADLASYTTDDLRVVVCEACGYADVPVDHRAAGDRPETWGEALARFRDRTRASGERIPLPVGGDVRLVDPDTYDRYADLTERQRAIVDELLAEPDPTDPNRTHAAIAEAAGVHRSYVGEVLAEFRDLVAALSGREPR